MYDRAEYSVQLLNGALDGEAVRVVTQRKRVAFAGDVYKKFKNHEAPGVGECGSSNAPTTDYTREKNYTWIQYPSDTESFSYPGDKMAKLAPMSVVKNPLDWRGDCFHPSVRGASEIAKIVNDTAQKVGR